MIQRHWASSTQDCLPADAPGRYPAFRSTSRTHGTTICASYGRAIYLERNNYVPLTEELLPCPNTIRWKLYFKYEGLYWK